MLPIINSTLCYLSKEQQYLMLHRVKKENDLNHDKWIGVGGKFEDLESPEDCAIRETLEETGLTMNSYRYRGIVTFVSERYPMELMHLFTSDDFSGEIKECDEGCLEWVDWDKIPELPIWEGDKIFLDLLRKDVPFFSLKLGYDQDDKLTCAVLNGEKLI